MNKANIVKTIKKLGIFVTGVTFTHYYNNVLSSAQLKAQQVKDQNTEKAIEKLNNNVNTIQQDFTIVKQDFTIVKQDTNEIGATVKNLANKVDQTNFTNKQLEVLNSKVENLDLDRENLEKLISEAQGLKPEDQAVVDKLLNKLNNDTKELQKFIDEYNNSENNSNLNFNLEKFYEKFYEFLDSLTLLQESAFLHIVMFITLLSIVFNILGALFGNEIIKYFNLEEKYPSLAKFFKLRSTFQKYYLTWNIILMLLLCFVGIGINIFVFYINP